MTIENSLWGSINRGSLATPVLDFMEEYLTLEETLNRYIDRLYNNDPTLTELIIPPFIGDKFATAFAPILKTNTSLTNLAFFYNQASAVGIIEILKALTQNSTLRFLDVFPYWQHNRHTRQPEMLELLKHNSGLTSINIGFPKTDQILLLFEYLIRNQNNLEKRSQSLFGLLIDSLFNQSEDAFWQEVSQ